MERITLQSGAILEITESDIFPQHALLQAVTEVVGGIDLSPLTSKKVNLNFIKDVFCKTIASEKVFKCIEPLLARVTYNGVKINDYTFFNNSSVKPDMLEVLKEVARVNLAPFGGGLLSMLKAQGVDLTEKVKTAQK